MASSVLDFAAHCRKNLGKTDTIAQVCGGGDIAMKIQGGKVSQKCIKLFVLRI